MSDTPIPLVYDEPTVMWKMQRRDGVSSHAVIDSSPDGPVVIWYINGRMLGFRNFGDWTRALQWSDQLQAQNWAAGWRLTPE
jgi:hypothetical protein